MASEALRMKLTQSTRLTPNLEHPLGAALQKRILILDGAMGTMIQQEKLEEADFRGKQFAKHPTDLQGAMDAVSYTHLTLPTNREV